MKQPTAVKLKVKLEIEGCSLPIGDLVWSRDDRLAAFEYDPAAIESGLEISPFKAKLAPGVIMGSRFPFDGLHGIFADSHPDGWGRLLVDRQITSNGGNPTTLTPVDRLAIVGSRGMGALTYAPENPIAISTNDETVKIDWFAHQAEMILQGKTDEGISRLLEASGGSAGARPKIMALRNPSSNEFHIDHGNNDHPMHEHWLIKLKHRKEGIDIGRIEYAYARMAKAAGINFPNTELITDDQGTAHFAVRRFDRTKAGRHHAHTLAGLLHADFRIPSLDYIDLLKATRILSRDQAQVEEAFRRMVFNVITGNRDDHAKNHAFLMSKDGRWRLSPAYDVTPSDGLGGEHNMTIAGEGKAPSQDHFTKVAATANISSTTARNIIECVTKATSSWKTYADDAGIGKADTSSIAKIIELNAKAAFPSRPPSKPRQPKSKGTGITD